MSDTPTLPAPKPGAGNDTRRSGVTEVGRSLPEWSVEPATHTSALAAGTLLHGKYVVGELVGQGGSNTVHRAHAPTLRREAALKVQSDAASHDPYMRRRFVREMRLLAAIDHPGVVKVFELGRLPTGPLIAALELLEGSTLRDVLRVQLRLTPVRAVEIAAQLCAALDAIHALDVLHRDLKPGNVIVLSDGSGSRVKLIDFGIACSITYDDAPITTPAEVVGTPGYLAPERTVFGGQIDGRSDLFALGVMLFEMLVGERPFGSTGASLARGIAEGPERLERALRERVSPELTALTLALLEAEPNDRPESAGAALERLTRVPEATGELTSAPLPAPVRPTVMVVSKTARVREAWTRAVQSAGASAIPLATLETAALLIEHGDPSSAPFVLTASEDETSELLAALLDAQKLAGALFVEPGRLAGSIERVRPLAARCHRLATPLTEADLRAVIAAE